MNIELPFTVKQLVADAHRSNKVLVLATGVFDVLHQEHRNFLSAAKAAGDVLIVGLESDKRVRDIKGKSRPVNSQRDRLVNLSKLTDVDGAFVLPVDFNQVEQREALIGELKPQILAVSSHTKYLEEKGRILTQVGGIVKVVYEHNPEVSSTKLLSEE